MYPTPPTKTIRITLDWHELAALSWAVNDAENVLKEIVYNYADCGGILSELCLYQTVGLMRLAHWKTELVVKLTRTNSHPRLKEFSMQVPAEGALMVMRWYLHSGLVDHHLRRVMGRIDQKLQGCIPHYHALLKSSLTDS